MKKKTLFTRFAEKTAMWTGRPFTFILAFATIAVWAITGPIFNYSDTWQLIINTGTTIITFLMVFLIQNTQNRDSHALHLKMDELIRATEGAHTVLLNIEELEDDELKVIREKYCEIAAEGRKRMRSGKSDTSVPEILLDSDFGEEAKLKD